MREIARFLSYLPAPLILFDAQAAIALANKPACDLLGYRAEQLIGRTLEWVISSAPNQIQAKRVRQMAESMRQSPVNGLDLVLKVMTRNSDGSEIVVEMRLKPYEEAGSRYTLASLCPLAPPGEARRRVLHLERIAAMRSQFSSLTMRARSRRQLFRETCRILVDVQAVRLAWIAGAAPGGTGIHLSACSGELGLDVQRLVEREETLLAGEIRRVLATRRPLWIHDGSLDPLAAPLRELEIKLQGVSAGSCAADPGYDFSAGSLVILPIQQDGVAVAALGLHVGKEPALDGEERRLLEELAETLSLALEHMEQRERLHRLASYDVLTGLSNRPRFMARVARCLRGASEGGRRLALVCFDLERFRNVNESLGSSGGDEVLRQVAAWLIAETNDPGMAARLGGDHFAFLIPTIQPQEDAEMLIERWVNRFQTQYFGGPENPLRLGVKVGIAMYPEDGGHAWTLFKQAEVALKQARASGNRYLFHLRPMSEKAAANFVLENQLHRAMDEEQYVLYYQPKVSLRDGHLSGVEALIRWNDPESGLVPPNHFIPLLEETGLIIDVGRWTLGRVMRDVERWRRMKLPEVRIAVNVSPAHLRHRQFLSDIEWAVSRYPDAASGLELEITEGMILEDIEQSTSILSQIRAMGVTVALDDFGTGFASLRNLSRLPLDTLKVDRSFVADLIESPARATQIKAIVDLAHAKRLNVVAEGVEREEQLNLLRLLGCDEMQGFLISKPAPCEIFEARFLSGDPLWPLSPSQRQLPTPGKVKSPMPIVEMEAVSRAKPSFDRMRLNSN